MDVASLSSIFTHWPTDWILIGACAAFVALDAMRSGQARAVALVLSLPASLLLIEELPKALFLGPLSVQLVSPLAQAGIFAAVTVALYFAAHRLIFKFSDNAPPIQALVSGLAAAIVLTVIWLQVPSLDSVWHFGDQVQAVFGVAYRFWWLLGSYIALAAVRN